MNAVIDTLFASRLLDPDLAPAAINAAFRLYMLPQGMFSVAVATVLFPALARLRRAERPRRVSGDGQHRPTPDRLPPDPGVDRVGRARRADRPPRLRARRVHGSPTSRWSPRCLAAFSLGLVFNGWMLMLTRGFYGLQSNWLPTVIGVGTLVPQRGARRGALPRRHLGDPARDVAREHRRRRASRRSSSGGASAASIWRGSSDAVVRVTVASVVLGARRVRRLVRARPGARSLDRRADHLARGRARARGDRVPRRLPCAPGARDRRAAADDLATGR